MRVTVWGAQTQEAAEVSTDGAFFFHINKDKQEKSHRKNNTDPFIWSASKHNQDI